jgi:hypothetical protein
VIGRTGVLVVLAATSLSAQDGPSGDAPWRSRLDLGSTLLRRDATGASDRGPTAIARFGRDLTPSGAVRGLVGLGGTVAGDGALLLDAGLEAPMSAGLVVRPIGMLGVGALVGSGVTSSYARLGVGLSAPVARRVSVSAAYHMGFSRLGRGPHWYLVGVEWRSASRPRPL